MIDSDLVGLWKIYKEKAYTMVLNYQYMKTAAGYHEDSDGIAVITRWLITSFYRLYVSAVISGHFFYCKQLHLRM